MVLFFFFFFFLVFGFYEFSSCWVRQEKKKQKKNGGVLGFCSKKWECVGTKEGGNAKGDGKEVWLTTVALFVCFLVVQISWDAWEQVYMDACQQQQQWMIDMSSEDGVQMVGQASAASPLPTVQQMGCWSQSKCCCWEMVIQAASGTTHRWPRMHWSVVVVPVPVLVLLQMAHRHLWAGLLEEQITQVVSLRHHPLNLTGAEIHSCGSRRERKDKLYFQVPSPQTHLLRKNVNRIKNKKGLGSHHHGSLALLFVMKKLMVCHFVSWFS